MWVLTKPHLRMGDGKGLPHRVYVPSCPPRPESPQILVPPLRYAASLCLGFPVGYPRCRVWALWPAPSLRMPGTRDPRVGQAGPGPGESAISWLAPSWAEALIRRGPRPRLTFHDSYFPGLTPNRTPRSLLETEQWMRVPAWAAGSRVTLPGYLSLS